MGKREFKEVEVDFAVIEAELGRLAPPKLKLVEVLERLRKRLVEQRSKGVTVTQMRDVLAARGVEVSERSLRIYLEKGELPTPGSRPSQGGESKEPF